MLKGSGFWLDLDVTLDRPSANIAERTDTPFGVSVIEPPPGTRLRLRSFVQ